MAGARLLRRLWEDAGSSASSLSQQHLQHPCFVIQLHTSSFFSFFIGKGRAKEALHLHRAIEPCMHATLIVSTFPIATLVRPWTLARHDECGDEVHHRFSRAASLCYTASDGLEVHTNRITLPFSAVIPALHITLSNSYSRCVARSALDWSSELGNLDFYFMPESILCHF